MTAYQQDSRFEAALEDCCRRVRQGESLARCLPDYPPEYREEMAELVPLSEKVALLRSDPSPEFQARLERRLLAQVDEARQPRGAGRRGYLARFFPPGALLKPALATLALLVVVTLTGAGVVNASTDSLPDSPLYRLKVAREWLQLAMARGGEAQVNVHAAQIAERGRELQKAIRLNKPARVVDLLALAVGQETHKMVDQALDLQAQGNTQQAARALVALRVMGRQLDLLAAESRPESRSSLQRLLSFMQGQERRLTTRGVAVPLR